VADRRGETPPPELTMVDPSDPFAPLHPNDRPPPAPVGFALKVLLLSGAALLVLALVGFHLLSGRAGDRDRRLDAEAALLRVQVLSAEAAPQQANGSPEVAGARVEVTLRNLSPVAVQVLRQRVEGGQSAAHSPAEPIGAGHSVVVEVVWRLRCAEIGNVAGPPLLALTLRGPVGDHQVRVALPLSTNRPFHLAASAACGTP
jgi:hypothetical protein